MINDKEKQKNNLVKMISVRMGAGAAIGIAIGAAMHNIAIGLIIGIIIGGIGASIHRLRNRKF